MNKTPVAVFTYNRPNYTEDVLKFLSQCHRLDECQVAICCESDVRFCIQRRLYSQALDRASETYMAKAPAFRQWVIKEIADLREYMK